MSEHTDSSANPKMTRQGRMAVAIVAAALFAAAGTLSLTACKQKQGKDMSAPAAADIPRGCSPATTPCE